MFWYLPALTKQKMTEILPYFAGLITILFGVGFGYAIVTAGKDVYKDK
jgi:uncharacterized membrane protein YfcA